MCELLISLGTSSDWNCCSISKKKLCFWSGNRWCTMSVEMLSTGAQLYKNQFEKDIIRWM